MRGRKPEIRKLPLPHNYNWESSDVQNMASFHCPYSGHHFLMSGVGAAFTVYIPDIIHLTCLAESDIRNVLLMTCNVGRGEAESNIACHEQDISNVGRHCSMLNALSSHKTLLCLVFTTFLEKNLVSIDKEQSL